VLSVLVIALTSSMVMRHPVILDVIRDRNTLYRDAGRLGIENSYTLRIINEHNQDHSYRLSVSGLDRATLRSDTQVDVAAESVFTLPT
jgi:polyferredoxin